MTPGSIPARTGKPKLGYVVTAMFAMQFYVGLVYYMPSVYAPVVARHAGLPAQSVGFYMGVMIFAGLLAALFFSQYIRRLGALRVVQAGTLLQAVGVSLAAPGSPSWLLLSAVLAGAGNGTILPAAIQLLVRVAPPGRLSFIIALHQIGPPIGAAVAGAAVPALLRHMGWEASLLPTVLLGVALLFAVQPLRASLDSDRDRSAPLRSGALLGPWLLALRDRSLRAVGISSLMLSMMSSVYAAFMVSYLNIELEYTLVFAGFVLSLTQIPVVLGRLWTGWVADRAGDPLRVLGIFTLAVGAMTCFAALLAHVQLGALGLAVVVVAITLCNSWPAVFLAATARNAPEGKTALATAGVQLYSLAATVIGPVVFAVFVSMLGLYSSAYLAFGAACFASGGLLLASNRRLRRAEAARAGSTAR